MKCPRCGSASAVLDTRSQGEYGPPGYYRRRECTEGHRFVTVERVETMRPTNDKREPKAKGILARIRRAEPET